MNKVVTLALMCAVLSACVGTQEGSSSSSEASSSSPNVSSLSELSSSSESFSIPSISSAASSVMSSAQAISSSSAPAQIFDGNAVNGKSLLKSISGDCFVCHEDGNEDGFFEAKANSNGIDVNNFEYPSNPAFTAGNYTGASAEDLARFIDERMPNATSCKGQCAEDIAAYLWSLRGQSVVVGPTECAVNDPVYYGRRALKFLTRYEYHNSIQALFGAPLPADYSSSTKIAGDFEVAGLPNHGYSKVQEGRVNSYDANAAEIAEWALETPGALPFSCSQARVCADSFIEEFAFYAFRRPLTEAEEAEFTAIISEATSLELGLKWAIRHALMAPQFLYRSELGKTAAQTLADINAAPTRVIYQPAAEPVVVTGNSPANSGYDFTGNDLVLLTVKATPKLDYSVFPAVETDIYPAVRIVGNGFESEALPVKGPGPVTLKFHMSQLMGSVYYMTSQQVSTLDGVEYGGGYEVLEVAVAPAKVKETPQVLKDKVALADANAYVLDEFEYASALAYILTGSSPDTELLALAYSGELEYQDLLEAQVERLIDSPLGQAQVARFAGLWFGTDKVATVNRFGNPAFNAEVKASMAQEIRELYKHVFYDETESYRSLFQADYTMLNDTLSNFYGISGSAGEGFTKASTQGTSRGGLIASGAFMALYAHDNRTSPIQRAVHLRQDLLCQSIPQPGALNDGEQRKEAAAIAQAREEQGTLTTTEFYDIQTNVPGTSCAICHNAVINPLFAMDDFDNVGLPRDMVGDLIVQTGLGANGVANVPVQRVNDGGYLYSGDVIGSVDTQVADAAKAQGNGIYFKGAKQLSKAMVSNNLPGIDACLVQKTYRFALGSPIRPSDVDSRYEPSLSNEEKGQMLCMQEQLNSAMGAANNPKAMLKALVLSDVVRFRR